MNLANEINKVHRKHKLVHNNTPELNLFVSFLNEENRTEEQLGTGKNPFVLCRNIHSLQCHRDKLKYELENYGNKPAMIALTETWLTENDDLENDYNLEKCQPIESKPRPSGQQRGGVAFYVQDDIKYKVIEFQSENECLIIQTNFDTKTIRNFCVIYRPHRQKIPSFFARVRKFTRVFTAIAK